MSTVLNINALRYEENIHDIIQGEKHQNLSGMRSTDDKNTSKSFRPAH
jgi:hypothetical protein